MPEAPESHLKVASLYIWLQLEHIHLAAHHSGANADVCSGRINAKEAYNKEYEFGAISVWYSDVAMWIKQ